MGSASSRPAITQALLDTVSAALRRMPTWDTLQVFVRNLKGAIGLGQNSKTVLQTETLSTAQETRERSIPPHDIETLHSQVPDPVAEATSQSSGLSSTHQAKDNKPDAFGTQPKDQELGDKTASSSPPRGDEPRSGARDEAEDDRKVDEITKALEDAAPVASSKPKVAHQDDATVPNAMAFESARSNSMSEDDLSSKTEPQPNFSVRETYANRIERLDEMYNREAPELGLPCKPTASKSDLADDYDNQLVEYAFSSLMVALPQPHNTEGAKRIVFQPPVHITSEESIVQPSTDLESTAPSSGGEAFLPDEGSFEAEVETALLNYRSWDRTLYAKLHLDQSSIRLADIMPGAMADDLHVSMCVHPLNEVSKQYEALSYVWGNPEPAKKIFVNQVAVAVNPSLYDALVSLRQHESIRRIWIDAICINQTSFAEKSKEVRKMGQIYSLAKIVNIFLGVSSPQNSNSIEAFLQFLDRDEKQPGSDEDFQTSGLKRVTDICEKHGAELREICTGFVQFCAQQWWGRIWTLQEFYLSEKEPRWYCGRTHASNASLKRDFTLLTNCIWDMLVQENAHETILSDIKTNLQKPIGSFKVDMQRISALISRRYSTAGFDSPQRLYRELTAKATNPRDFIYGLRAIFDPVFGRVFVPDYRMDTELLFACLAIFLIQFECWGDALWWYPSRYAVGTGAFPSWLPNFTQRVIPHELDMQPLDPVATVIPEPKMVVLNHRLHAEGYKLDKVYGHRHLDKHDGQKIFEELWQFDHCMNQNHECHKYVVEGVGPEDPWLKTFVAMYKTYYTRLSHFNSSFRGAILQSTIKQKDADKLPRRVAECVPSWDILQWHALRLAPPELPEMLGRDVNSSGPGCLEDVFSPRMANLFRNSFADFFIGACIFDWGHFAVWLKRFPTGTQWSEGNDAYWSEIRDSASNDTEKRVKAITKAYEGYQVNIAPEVMQSSWCYSFYYTFLAYVILLDCDDHASLAAIILKLQTASETLRSVYFATTTKQLEKLASCVPSVAARVSHHSTVIDLFRGRHLIWTFGGFRGISCPGVTTCCDQKSIVAIVDGQSLPVIVRDYNEETGEGWLAGCAVIRGVDMLNKDTENAVLPPDYKKGERTKFKFT